MNKFCFLPFLLLSLLGLSGCASSSSPNAQSIYKLPIAKPIFDFSVILENKNDVDVLSNYHLQGEPITITNPNAFSSTIPSKEFIIRPYHPHQEPTTAKIHYKDEPIE